MRTLNPILSSFIFFLIPFIGSAQFSGTYQIGSGEDYEVLSELISDLEIDGIDAALLIEINPGTYDEQVVIPYIEGVSETNTITITSSTNDSADVVLTASPPNEGDYNEFNYVIALEGAQYIHIEDLTIKNTSSYYGTSIVLRNNSQYNKLENLHLYRYPESIQNQRYSLLRTSDQAHNNIIEQSTFTGGSYGWYGYGEDDILDSLNIVRECIFWKQSFTGISASQQKQFSALNNVISAGDVYSIYRGINIHEGSDKFIIANNRINIDHIKGGHGIATYYCTEGSESSQIVNNFVSIYCEDNNTQTGIFITSSPNINIYHNSVYLKGSSPFAKCIRVTGNASFPSDDISVKNNILLSSAFRLCLEYDNHTSVTSDYNWVYTNGSYFGEWLNQDITSFSSWKSNSGQDEHSVFMPPALVQFQNDSDLYVLNDTLAYFGDSLGVSFDIDATLRVEGSPKVGAHEYIYVEGVDVDPEYPELLCTNNTMENLWWADMNAYGSVGDKIIALENNNFLMTGIRESSGFIMDSTLTNPGTKTAFVAEWSLDSQLVKLYESSFDGAFTNVAQNAAGDIIVEGYVYGEFEFAGETLPASNYYNYFIAAFNSSGNELWCKIRELNSSSLKIQHSALAPNGNIAWVSQFSEELSEDGQTYTGEGSSNLFLQLYNSEGEALWNKIMEGHFHVMEQILHFDSNNDLIIAGRMSDWTEIDGEVFLCDNDIYLWRFDQSGVLSNSITFGGPGIEYPQALEIDENDNVIVAGYFNWGDFVVDTDIYLFEGELDAFAVKFDANFDYKWSWHYGSAYPDEINALAIDPQGNVILGGKYAEAIGFSYTYNMNMTKLNAFSGEELWTRNYGHDDENEMIYSLAINANGDILSSGRYESVLTFDGFFYALSDNSRRVALMHYSDDNPYPEVEIVNETCPGLSNGSISILNAEEDWQINWDNGESGPIVLDLAAGIYELEIENGESCNFIGSYNINTSELLGIIAEEESVCQGDSIWLESGSIGDSYQWSNGDTSYGSWFKDGGWAYLDLQLGTCSLVDSSFVDINALPEFTFEESYSVNKPDILEIEGPEGMQTYNWIPDLGIGSQLILESVNWEIGEYLIILEVMDENGCTYSDSSIAIIDVNLAIKEFAASVRVYPNPSRTNVNISSAEDIDRVEIYSLNGAMILREDPSSRSFMLPLEGLASGIYKMVLYSGEMSHIERLIKL